MYITYIYYINIKLILNIKTVEYEVEQLFAINSLDLITFNVKVRKDHGRKFVYASMIEHVCVVIINQVIHIDTIVYNVTMLNLTSL